MALCFWGGLSAWGASKELRVLRDTELKQQPTEQADVLGVLPQDSMVGTAGHRENGYLHINVETENDEHLEGWVLETNVVEVAPPAHPTHPKGKQRRKIHIPQDEAALLKRDPSFLYGVLAGANYSIAQADNSGINYSGIGFSGGAFAGIFVSNNFPVHFEVTYSNMNLVGEDGQALGFGFLELGIIPHYILPMLPLEIFGGLQYAFGLSVGNLPRNVTLESPSDLSNFGLQIGAGYRIPLAYYIDMTARFRYSTLFQRSPFAFHILGLLLSLEFGG
ncbi:MAG: hypothetical protein HY537_00815 [Deltaproteobacteria bacterium]|nr:hypothetical protein [Deltaproteobacteria bacterium]